MSSIRIYNYEILNFERQPVIFSGCGFTKITNQKMLRVLRRIENADANIMHLDDLTKIIETESLLPEPAMEFLESISILGEHIEHPAITNIHIYSDLEIPETLKMHLTKEARNCLQISDLSTATSTKTLTPTLFIFVCAKLNPQKIRRLYRKAMALNPHSAGSIGFISGNYFHLTEAHIPSIGNPCAFCTLDRIRYYEKSRSSQHHWSKTWAFCSEHNLELPKTSLNGMETTLVLNTVIAFAQKITNTPKARVSQDQALLSRTLNFKTGCTTDDSSIHWPLCSCLGNKNEILSR